MAPLSLYPAVNYGVNGEFWPVGHPDIYIGKDLELAPANVREWFGLIRMSILPPRQLLHPVLGERSKDGKLLFHLCSTCASQRPKDYCTHTDDERRIHGTYFTGEIFKALDMGYSELEVFELWNWKPENRTDTLFKGLIRDQISKKAYSSPIPPKDSPEFAQLLKSYADIGVQLKPDLFQENEALRALAKFSVNNIVSSSYHL